MESAHVMVILIVAIIGFASVLKARYKAMHGIVEDENGNQALARPGCDPQLEAELKRMQERLAVLERIAADERQPRALAHEIEKLRDR